LLKTQRYLKSNLEASYFSWSEYVFGLKGARESPKKNVILFLSEVEEKKEKNKTLLDAFIIFSQNNGKKRRNLSNSISYS
jgi:hypothetical protein